MTLWTLGTCMSHATSAIGNRSDLASSVVSLYANQAALDVMLAVDPQQAEWLAVSSTTSGENRITLPSDFLALLALSDTSSVPPRLLTKLNYMDVDSSSTEASTPHSYVLYENYLELVSDTRQCLLASDALPGPAISFDRDDGSPELRYAIWDCLDV